MLEPIHGYGYARGTPHTVSHCTPIFPPRPFTMRVPSGPCNTKNLPNPDHHPAFDRPKHAEFQNSNNNFINQTSLIQSNTILM